MSAERPREASRLVAFGIHALDRRSAHRDRPGAIDEALAHPRAHVVVVDGDGVVVRREASGLHVSIDRPTAVGLGLPRERLVLLGWSEDGAPWIAAPLEAPPLALVERGLERVGLRALLAEPALGAGLLGVLAEARSVVDWHARHRFCAACGTGTTPSAAGHRRECATCGAHHFPRVDPVAIMLVVDRAGADGERCLLGRQARFPKGMYTCLAGFVEPGETIEDAVRREVREESSVVVGRVAYHASQPWPFPSSLMLGFHAEAVSTEVMPDREELEDCRWFAREEVRRMAARAHPDALTLPVPGTLSRRLIDDWLDAAVSATEVASP